MLNEYAGQYFHQYPIVGSQDLEADRVLITIQANPGYQVAVDDWVEPSEMEFPVHKNQITKTKFDPINAEREFQDKCRADRELIISRAREEAKAITDEAKKLKAWINKTSNLKAALAFLDPEISHVVVESTWSPKVLTMEEARKKDDKYDRYAFKAIVIEKSANQTEVISKISAYTDGSGSSEKVSFFKDEESAQKYLAKFITGLLIKDGRGVCISKYPERKFWTNEMTEYEKVSLEKQANDKLRRAGELENQAKQLRKEAVAQFVSDAAFAVARK